MRMVRANGKALILRDPTGNRRFWIWVDNHDEDNPIEIADLKQHLDPRIPEAG